MNAEYKQAVTRYPDLKAFDQNIQQLVQSGYFQRNTGIFINRTPGRLDLMGGNDDYTGGLVFETTIREATLVAVQPRSDQRIRFLNPAVKAIGWSEQIDFSLSDLMEDGEIKPLETVRSGSTAIQREPGARIFWETYTSC
jgi:L-arabinokinase